MGTDLRVKRYSLTAGSDICNFIDTWPSGIMSTPMHYSNSSVVYEVPGRAWLLLVDDNHERKHWKRLQF
jgi:hypothetical protein